MAKLLGNATNKAGSNHYDKVKEQLPKRTKTLVDIELEADSDLDEFETQNQQTIIDKHTYQQPKSEHTSSSNRPGSLEEEDIKIDSPKGSEDSPFSGVKNSTNTFIDQSNFSYFQPFGV